MKTPIQSLEALIEARKKATKGLWEEAQKVPNIQIFCQQRHIASTATKANMPYDEKCGNAKFIAQAAHFAADHAPALLARIRQLEGALRCARSELVQQSMACETADETRQYITKHVYPIYAALGVDGGKL